MAPLDAARRRDIEFRLSRKSENYSSLLVVWVCLVFLPLGAFDCLRLLCGRFISSQIIWALSQCSTSHPSGHPSSCQIRYASCRISSLRSISVPCIVLPPIEFKLSYTALSFFCKKFFRQREPLLFSARANSEPPGVPLIGTFPLHTASSSGAH